MTVRIYVPRDAAALALGAEKVAKALAGEIASRNLDVTIIRNGSRGMHWLEPLVEVETANGRIAYGPVKASDVVGLLDSGLVEGKAHALCLGLCSCAPAAMLDGEVFGRMDVETAREMIAEARR